MQVDHQGSLNFCCAWNIPDHVNLFALKRRQLLRPQHSFNCSISLTTLKNHFGLAKAQNWTRKKKQLKLMLLTHRFVTNSFVLFAKALTSIGNEQKIASVQNCWLACSVFFTEGRSQIDELKKKNTATRLRAWDSAKGFVIKAAPSWHVKEIFTCSGLKRCLRATAKATELGNLLWISRHSMSFDLQLWAACHSCHDWPGGVQWNEQPDRDAMFIKIAFDMKRILSKVEYVDRQLQQAKRTIIGAVLICMSAGEIEMSRLGVVHC